MSLIAALPPPPSSSAPPSSGAAPPGAPPGALAFESALAEHWARTAHAEGQQQKSPQAGEEQQPKSAISPEQEVPANAEAMLAPFVTAISIGEPTINEQVSPPTCGSRPGTTTNAAQAGSEASPAATAAGAAPAPPIPGEPGHGSEPEGQQSQPPLATGTAQAQAQPGTELSSQNDSPRLASGEEVASAAAGSPAAPPTAPKTAGASAPAGADRSIQDAMSRQRAASEPQASNAHGDSALPTAATVVSAGALSQGRAQGATPESSSGHAEAGANTLPSAPSAASASGTEATTAGLEMAAPTPSTTVAASPGVATQTVTGVPMQEMIETIRASIEIAARAGSTQAHIALQPEELGHISIHLSQTSEGLLARVTADTPAAAQALVSARSELHQSLSSLGATLLRLDIGSSDGRDRDSRFAGDPQATNTARASANADGQESVAAVEEIDSATQPRGLPRGELLDVFA
jgi:flagellar hook-length control protein FliK